MKIVLVIVTLLFWGFIILFNDPITIKETLTTVLFVSAIILVAITLIVVLINSIKETK